MGVAILVVVMVPNCSYKMRCDGIVLHRMDIKLYLPSATMSHVTVATLYAMATMKLLGFSQTRVPFIHPQYPLLDNL